MRFAWSDVMEPQWAWSCSELGDQCGRGGIYHSIYLLIQIDSRYLHNHYKYTQIEAWINLICRAETTDEDLILIQIMNYMYVSPPCIRWKKNTSVMFNLWIWNWGLSLLFMLFLDSLTHLLVWSQSVAERQWFFIIIFAYLIIIRLGGHLLQNTSQTWHIR